MSGIRKDDPDAVRAIDELNATVGYDIRVVLDDQWWRVAAVGGRVEVLFTADGVRALARFAPRPDAPEIAERIIRGKKGAQ